MTAQAKANIWRTLTVLRTYLPSIWVVTPSNTLSCNPQRAQLRTVRYFSSYVFPQFFSLGFVSPGIPFLHHFVSLFTWQSQEICNLTFTPSSRSVSSRYQHRLPLTLQIQAFITKKKKKKTYWFKFIMNLLLKMSFPSVFQSSEPHSNTKYLSRGCVCGCWNHLTASLNHYEEKERWQTAIWLFPLKIFFGANCWSNSLETLQAKETKATERFHLLQLCSQCSRGCRQFQELQYRHINSLRKHVSAELSEI